MKSGNLVTDLSDHFPNFISIKDFRFDPKNKHKTKYKQVRQHKPYNTNGFKNSLSIVNWNFVLDDNDPNNSYSNFLQKTPNLLDIHYPIKTIKISNRKTTGKPWITFGLKNLLKLKINCIKIYNKTNNWK